MNMQMDDTSYFNIDFACFWNSYIRGITNPEKTGLAVSAPIDCPDCGHPVAWGAIRSSIHYII